MSADNVAQSRDSLRFDRALTAGAPADGGSGGTSVTCENCSTSISTAYYHIGKHVVCAACRDTVLAHLEMPRGWKPFLKAGVYGVGAAIAGAIVYYGVIAITNFEIGIVAILIGYMVGFMVGKGTGGRGGRRFQILAVALTYWSVGLAYTPLAFKGTDGKQSKQTVSTDSLRATHPDTTRNTANVDSSLTRSEHAPKNAEPTKNPGRVLLIGLGALVLMTLALPVLMVIGSLPSGFISAIIIAVGLRQAWRMTGAPTLTVTGPYKVGGDPATAPA